MTGPVPTPVRRGSDLTIVHTARFDAPDTSNECFALSWGQERILELEDSMRPGHAQLNMRLVVSVRAGTTIDDALGAITRMVEACHSVRTTYVRNRGAPPLQRVHGAGALSVVEVDVVPGEDHQRAHELAEDLSARPMADADWPLRVAVVSVAGEPRQLVIAARHIAVDYFGLAPLLEALGGLVGTEAHDTRDYPPVSQPADVVAWEQSPRGQRDGARATRRNLRTFEQMPASMVPRLPAAADTPRYRYVRLESRCLTHTLGSLATRHGVSETSVLYGVLSVLVAHIGGLDRAHWQVCTANRLDRATASAVATLTQDTPTWIDVADHDFVKVLERSSRALLDATLHGRFPHADLAPDKAETEARRGVALDCSYWINSRLSGHRPTQTSLSIDELDKLRDEATLMIEAGGDLTSTSTAFVYADRLGDTTTIRMLVDTAYVPPDEARGWLGAIDTMLLHAFGGETRADVLATAAGLRAPSDTEWALVDHSRVHLPTVVACLRAAGAPVTSVRVDAATDGPAVLIAVATKVEEAVTVLRSDRAYQMMTTQRVAMLPHTVEDGTGGRHFIHDPAGLSG